MVYQKIKYFLNNLTNELSIFRRKNQVEINGDACRTYEHVTSAITADEKNKEAISRKFLQTHK